MQKELKKLAKSHPSGSFPQPISATPAQTDRAPGPRTTTPKPVPFNTTGRPQMPTTAINTGPTEHNSADLSQKRGKKREFEESVAATSPLQNNRPATPPASVVTGMNGTRPRPIKKQRVVRRLLGSSMTLQYDHHQRIPKDQPRREIYRSSNNQLHRVFEVYKFTLFFIRLSAFRSIVIVQRTSGYTY